MSVTYDPAVLRELRCPLCFSRGTLRPIRLGKRLRTGPLSFLLTLFRSFECTACAATFSTEQLLRDREKV